MTDRISYKLARERKTLNAKRIDWQALAIGKGPTVKQTRAKAKREDAKQLKAFIDAVWAREQDKLFAADHPGGRVLDDWARCQGCRKAVFREDGPNHGDVHHVVSRRHKSTRYDVANGQLLCRTCHQLIHGREF